MNVSIPQSSQTAGARRTFPKRRQTINGWLLLCTAVVLFILAPSLYLWHYYQTRRLAESFLVRADELQEQHDPHTAAEYLQRYLQIKPENADVRIRLAEVYDSSATDFPGKRRAIELYFQAIGWAEEQKIPSLRCRVGEMLLETSQFIAAEKQARTLLDEVQRLGKSQQANREFSGLSAKAVRMRALAIYGQAEQGAWKGSEDEKRSVCEILEDALQSNRDDRELIRSIIRIYREEPQFLSREKRLAAAEERNRQADRYMDDLVSADPEDAEALLMRYSYRRVYQLPGAQADLERAMHHGRHNARVLLAKADAEQTDAQEKYRQSGRIDAAAALFDSATKNYTEVLQITQEKLDAENRDEKGKRKPDSTTRGLKPRENWREIQQYAWVNLGTIQKIRGKSEEAVKTWKAGLERIPQSMVLNLLLADSLLELGRVDETACADKSTGKEGPLDALETLVTRLGSDSRANAATETEELKYRSQVNALEQTVHLLRGKWHYQRGEMQLAVPLLQQVMQGDKNTLQQTNEILQANLLMGDIYFRRDQMDQAATAFEAAAALGLKTALPHLGAARAWESLGRFDLAEKHLRQAVEVQDTAENRLRLAQVVFRRETQKPNDERQWSDLDKLLSSVRTPKGEPDPTFAWQTDLLAIQSAYVRQINPKETAAARAEFVSQLKKLEDKYANIAAVSETLIPIYASLNAPELAERLAAQYAQQKPREAQTFLLRARVAMIGRHFDQAQSILEEGIRQTPPQEQGDLKRELIGLNISQNRLKEAAERLQTLLKTAKNDQQEAWDADTVKLVFAMALQTLEKKESSESKRWEDELVRLEGPEGTLWRYCRARRFAIMSKDQNDPRLAEAERMLAELKKMRPAWAQEYLLEAVISQKRGKLAEAVDAYRNAIQFGCRQITVYERLVELLGRLGRYAEIEQCLAGLNDQSTASTTLMTMGISLAAERGQWQQAIELARKNSEIQDRDPQAAITLSRVLEMDNQQEQAEATLQKALQTTPENASLHYQLMAFYVRNGKKQAAADYIEKLKDNRKIREAERMRLLAQGYDLIQNSDNSKAAWDRVIGLTKDTPEEQTALAEQLINRDVKAAETALRKALKKDGGSSRARRLLAQILVARGGEEEWNEALGLLSDRQTDPQEEQLCRKLKAMIYASRGGKKNLEQARLIVEKMVSDSNEGHAEERMLLARIYESQGKRDLARKQLQTLVQSTHPSAAQVATYVEFLLQSERPSDEASAGQEKQELEKWVNKLHELAPDNLQSVAMKARFCKKFDRQKEIEPLVEAWAEKIQPRIPKRTRDEALLFEKIGDLYTSVQLNSAAERWYRRAMEKDPARYGSLARSLARQGRYEAALEVCKEVAVKDSSSQPYITAAVVMLDGQASAKDYERTDTFLAKAEEMFRNQPEFLSVLAALRIQESRMEEAISLLRRVVELRPRDVLAINNLATLLAEQPGKLSEGKRLLAEAIALAGPQAGLLDLQGVILIAEGNPREAIPLFEEACASPQTDPRYCFHGAVAYQRAGELKKAQQALQRARSLNLDQQILTPGDKKVLAELEHALIRKNL